MPIQPFRFHPSVPGFVLLVQGVGSLAFYACVFLQLVHGLWIGARGLKPENAQKKDNRVLCCVTVCHYQDQSGTPGLSQLERIHSFRFQGLKSH